MKRQFTKYPSSIEAGSEILQKYAIAGYYAGEDIGYVEDVDRRNSMIRFVADDKYCKVYTSHTGAQRGVTGIQRQAETASKIVYNDYVSRPQSWSVADGSYDPNLLELEVVQISEEANRHNWESVRRGTGNWVDDKYTSGEEKYGLTPSDLRASNMDQLLKVADKLGVDYDVEGMVMTIYNTEDEATSIFTQILGDKRCTYPFNWLDVNAGVVEVEFKK